MARVKVEGVRAGTFKLPKAHKPGMRVPEGGSSCANCRHYDGAGNCEEPSFGEWNGGKKIPSPTASTYCSDWWEPKE